MSKLAIVACLLGVWVGIGVSDANKPRMHMLYLENYHSAAEMMAAMDLVAVADVTNSTEGRFVDDRAGGIQFHETRFVIHEALSGDLKAGDPFVLEHMVAERGRFALGRQAFDPYEVGTRHLLMLRKQPESEFYILANAQGRFAVDASGRVWAPDHHLPVADELDGRILGEASGYLRGLR